MFDLIKINREIAPYGVAVVYDLVRADEGGATMGWIVTVRRPDGAKLIGATQVKDMVEPMIRNYVKQLERGMVAPERDTE